MKLMLPPNCLTKHARSFRAFKTAIRQLRQINCILDGCTISPVAKLAKLRKPYCCFRIQPKEQAHHRKSSMHKYRHALTMSIIFHMMGSTRTLIFSAHRNDGAMRHILVRYLSPLPHSGSDKSAVLALALSSKHHQS